MLSLLNNTDKTKFVVAFSGGLDSTVLLHAARQDCIAVHVNHGLSPNADAWAEHCKNIAAEFGVTFFCEQVNAVAKTGQSPEDAARIARYQVLKKYIGQDSCLLTAHTQDDQCETVLLQLMRGAGPKGLAAMPLLSEFSDGEHARPLIDHSRNELLLYATEHNLRWIEDESNTDTTFNRNYIRHKVLPVIKERWPMVNKAVARVARHCANSSDLLDELAQQDLIAVQGSEKNKIAVSGLRQLSSARQKNVLRYWIAQNGSKLPSTAQLEQIISQFVYSANDKHPYFKISAFELRRHNNEIHIQANMPIS